MQLQDLVLEFDGDQTRSSRAEFVQAGLLGRLRRALRSQYNSSGPTETHRENYQIVKDAFSDVHQKLKSIDKNLGDLQGNLKKAGIRWPVSPALPGWSGQ